MSGSVNVRSIQALDELKTAINRFASEAPEPVRALEREAMRTLEWLEKRRHYWEQAVRTAQDAVRGAEAALAYCRASARFDPQTGRAYVPDCSGYEMELRRAVARLREAEENLHAARRWQQTVQEQTGAYQRQAQRFAGMVASDLPKATALLDRKVAALQSYAALGLFSALAAQVLSSLRDGGRGEAVVDSAPATTDRSKGLPAQFATASDVQRAFDQRLSATLATYAGRLPPDMVNNWVNDRNVSFSQIAREAQRAGLDAAVTGSVVHRVAELRTLAHQPHRILNGTRFVEFSPGESARELDLITVKEDTHYIHDYKPINLAAIDSQPWAAEFHAWLDREHGGDFAHIGNYRSMPQSLRCQFQSFLKTAVAAHRAQLGDYCRLYGEAAGLPPQKVRPSILPYFVWR
jgi:hypothetical protein